MTDEPCVYCDGERMAEYFLDDGARYNPCCGDCHRALFVPCDHCDQDTLIAELVDVCVARQTHESPAEYVQVCRDCASGPDERDWDDVDD